MRMRDELGAIFEDEIFAELFPRRGKPAFSPWRLALVTVMQFAEGLSDRQAANAVRARIDWKYALSLELTDPGFDASVLCEFRARLMEGEAETLLLDALLERLREQGLLKTRGRQRTDSTHVLAAVRDLGRLELMGETMRGALNALAISVPDWLREHADDGWVARYAGPFDDRRLPKGAEKRRVEAERIGVDGFELLEAIGAGDSPSWLRELPAVETLRQVWLQNYLRTPDGVRWRRSKEEGLPPASRRIDSPTDADSRRAFKGELRWIGYKVHLTETCDDDAPRILTHVETATAPTPDRKAVRAVHQALGSKTLLPSTHLVDMGYTDASALLEARDVHGVDLFGPMRSNYEWHAREGTGFDLASFEIDWEKEEATCPEGKKSIHWRHRTRRGQPVLGIAFSPKDCGDCPSRDLCVRRKRRPGHGRPYRELTVSSRERYEALKIAREREKTPSYAEEYARRDGIEGTISRAVRSCGIRRSRYRGIRRTHLQHVLTAAAMNFVRVGEWLRGEPRAPARSSPFVRAMEGATAA